MILLKNNNKVLKNKEGKVLLSHNIPFTPVCESYIDYDANTHTFIKKRGLPTSVSGAELESDFRIPANLCGDFEISFTPRKAHYFTVCVYNNDISTVRGFYMSLGRVTGAEKVDKSARIIVSGAATWDTYFKVTESKKITSLPMDKIWDKTFVIRRINGIVSLYIDTNKYYTYEEAYNQQNLSIYGISPSLHSEIRNFSIKQL